MASEPERPIENLLRAAAKKRRDEAGPPFELHPATRRLLQGEAARKFPPAQPDSPSLFATLGRLWPRFAWALAILAVLGVAVWLLVPLPARHDQTALLASKEPMKEAPWTGEPIRSLSAAPTAPHVQAEAAAEAKLQAVTDSDKAKSGARPQPIGKDILAMRMEDGVRKEPARESSPPPAGGRRFAEAQHMPSGSQLAPQRADAVSGASPQQDKFATASIPAARVPVMPASSPSATEPRMASDVALADAPVSLAREKSVASSTARKSRAEEDRSASRQAAALAAADDLLASSPPALGKAGGASLGQRFVQVALGGAAKTPAADKAKAAQAVLASFLVEQTDRELRITDADGSVYSGYVRAADAARMAREIRADAPAAARASKAASGTLPGEAASAKLNGVQLALQNYAFRVVGTNRTLRKKVVFTGNLLATSSPVGRPPTGAPAAIGTLLEKTRADSVQQTALPLLNSRIAGKVVIGSGTAIEINALPAAP